MAHKGQAKCVVWQFFTVNEDDPTKVTCKLCNVILTRGKINEKKFFNTSNMQKHLKTKHQEQLKQEEELQAKEQAQTAQKRTMSDYVTAKKKGPMFKASLQHQVAPLHK